MARVRATLARHRRKKRVLKQTKGQFGQKKSRFAQAARSLNKGRAYQFRDRKVRKREFRKLWIIRINAACREQGITYSSFIKGLNTAKVQVNRKMIAELAVSAPEAFRKLFDVAKAGK